MVKVLDLESWGRKDHFEFFRSYERPFFNICTHVDVTALRRHCKAAGGPSFFIASLFLSLKAANDVEEIRYRMRGDQVVVYEVIHGGSTILRPDETFAFAYFDYDPDFALFEENATRVLEAVRSGPPRLEPRPDRDDLIHYSVIPWVAFTSFSHARSFRQGDSVPKIVFGKVHRQGKTWRMPLSVEVHHALVDGLHVGRFVDRFEHYLAGAHNLQGARA